MKFVSSRFVLVASAIALPLLSASAQTTSGRQAIVITTPAVHNGSNWSRAPFPAARQFDDVQRPDGAAIDRNVPPNTPATTREPDPIPPARVAIFQPRTPSPTAPTEPMLAMTGRSTVSVAAPLQAASVAATLQTATIDARDPVIADIESRMKTADHALASMRGTMSQMSVEGRNQFKLKEDDAKVAEKALHKSLRNARKANAADWEAARAQLAADYQAYANALATLDVAAGIAPAR